MTQMPEGAQRSEDGNYWWDEQTQQWQLIEGGGGAAGAGAGSSAAPAGATDAPAGAAAAAGGGAKTGTATADGAERPADAQPIHEVALLEGGQADVPEMSSEQGEHESEEQA